MGATIDDHGGVGVHYDRNLPANFAVSWNNMMSGFSWKKSLSPAPGERRYLVLASARSESRPTLMA